MGEFDFLRNIRSESPLLLFDDIFGELDSGRISNMIDTLSKIGQVFITTTSSNFFGKVDKWTQDTHFYQIEEGSITAQGAA